MSAPINPRREAARSCFESLESALRADEVLADKRCVRLMLDKARTEPSATARKRFDPRAAFCTKLFYGTVDAFLGGWCRRREIKTDPYNVFRYEGPERGPTQHETGMGPSIPFVERTFDRLAAEVPEFGDMRAAVAKPPNQAVAPGFRLQHPLPFGAAGEVVYDPKRQDLDRGVYLVAQYAATGGDPSRQWRYDCGLLVTYTLDSPRALVGPELWEQWSDVRERLWRAARVWVILL